jgi:nitroimidazol reductase NimA-like FMN-containing flavoprotein (pyridoxamine 5'-phosphate oxidase superfamily)
VILDLTSAQVRDLLGTQQTGRLNCYRHGRTHVLPVTYEYRGSELTVRTPSRGSFQLGGDCDAQVRFEVDRVRSIWQWETIVGWGRWERVQPNTFRILLSELRGFQHTQNRARLVEA